MHDAAYLIGRQPILNGQEEITAFELLFRSPESVSSARFESPLRASSQVILATLSAIGIEPLLGRQHGFVNVDADLLMNDVIELLPHERIGLELLESIEITPDVVKRCRTLKSRGYRLVLDDHEYHSSFEPLYDGLVEIVKIDLVKTPLGRLPEMVERFQRYPVKLLAEKVETRGAFLRCRSLGVELFQGYFFARPSLIQRQQVANALSSFLTLMQQLVSGAETSEIETTFKQSPALVYKLLLLVNSVSVGLHEKIRTIRHAITIIGRQQLKRWVQIALFAGDGHQGANSPIMHLAVTRATFMEELARTPPHIGSCSPDEAFMVGILSILKDIYEVSVEEVVASLGLSDDIRNALTGGKGEMSVLLSLARMLEENDFDEAAECFEVLGIPLPLVLECQRRAFNWHQALI
ncbi:EAL and HDOD domain-containing protein [Geobacter sp. AOG2]|uniref:EAL and HDOD domain-containing protein n=1 Tax=Geobacter sp. AOG2 TaxID=1566347 RepID=UPI001CC7B4E8|nr:EAL domain-containing protein [Geobacter sp. AOG2]GFE60175.1 cyclic diguanylate phosphodiesterase [Geobacter sp. AOG2]